MKFVQFIIFIIDENLFLKNLNNDKSFSTAYECSSMIIRQYFPAKIKNAPWMILITVQEKFHNLTNETEIEQANIPIKKLEEE